MKVRFGNWLPATLAACALLIGTGTGGGVQAAETGNGGATVAPDQTAPAGAVRYVVVKSGTPDQSRTPDRNHTPDRNRTPDRNHGTCVHGNDEHFTGPVYLIGPDTDKAVSDIAFSGNTIFDREYLLGIILSKEFHWYRWLSKDYVSFRGPAQSRALLELKGVIANEDFGYINPRCGEADFGRFKGFSNLRDFISLRDFIISSEHLYNPDIAAVDRALIKLNYWRHGFMDAEVAAPKRDVSDERHLALTYAITEGTRYRFGKIALKTTIAGFDPEDLRYAVDIKTGDWYDPVAVNDLATHLDSVKFSSQPLFKALDGHLPFAVCVKPDSATPDHANKADRIIDVTFTIVRCSDADDASIAPTRAKPAPGAGGKRLGTVHRKPATVAPVRQARERPDGQVGVASAGDAGSR